MDFDELFTEQKVVDCSREHRIIGIILLLNLVSLAIDCVSACKRYNEFTSLKKENETLKSIILKSVDKAFLRMMKNGNDSEDEHEE
jgi:hypothetical protein